MQWSRFALVPLSLLAACSMWITPAVAPRVLLARDTLEYVRLTLAGQPPVMVNFVSLRDDSVQGVIRSAPPATGFVPFAAPVDQVQQIQFHRKSALRTLGAVVLVLGAGAITPYLLGN